MTNQNKVFQYKVIITLGIVLIATLIIGGWLDTTGRNYTEDGIKRALATYAIARGLNGVISVAQGTEVAIEPVGVGVTFTPGQILDPINDLIERFSWIVLASSVSLGAQNVLLSMTEWLWFGVTVGVFLIIALLAIWQKQLFTETTKKYLYKATLILVILRLAVPVIAVVNQGVYQIFLEPQYQESKVKLEETTTLLEESTPTPVETEEGFFERAQKVISDASDAFNIDQKMDELKKIASDISQYVMNMIVVFVLQTIIFPLLFLWLTYRSIVTVVNYK